MICQKCKRKIVRDTFTFKCIVNGNEKTLTKEYTYCPLCENELNQQYLRELPKITNNLKYERSIYVWKSRANMLMK